MVTQTYQETTATDTSLLLTVSKRREHTAPHRVSQGVTRVRQEQRKAWARALTVVSVEGQVRQGR